MYNSKKILKVITHSSQYIIFMKMSLSCSRDCFPDICFDSICSDNWWSDKTSSFEDTLVVLLTRARPASMRARPRRPTTLIMPCQIRLTTNSVCSLLPKNGIRSSYNVDRVPSWRYLLIGPTQAPLRDNRTIVVDVKYCIADWFKHCAQIWL